MLRSLIAALALTALCGTAWAETPAPAAEPAAAPAEPAPLEPGQERVKVRCKKETVVGSRFAKRTCRRVDDLARAERDALEAINDASRRKTFIDTSGRTP